MTAASFHVIHARWARDREALRHIRETVFIHGQNVPAELEWDGLDEACDHVLALDAHDEPIGTARLTGQHSIGRMAVLAPWRGKGIGAAMLSALLDKAREHQWAEVTLHAQVDAIGFYRRFGFVCAGEEFMEAGIRHRLMRKTLSATRIPGQSLNCATHTEATQAVMNLLASAKHRLCICSPDLMPSVIDNEVILTAMRRLADSGRHASVRCLLQDTSKVQRESQRLLALAQRLPSIVQLRTPTEPEDVAYAGAFILNDAAGYLHYARADAPIATGHTHAPGRHRTLFNYFEQVWERSAPATELRQLSL